LSGLFFVVKKKLFVFGFDATGTNFSLYSGDFFALQINLHGSFGFSIGVRDVIGTSSTTSAHRANIGHILDN
jgi:hypothetical protein